MRYRVFGEVALLPEQGPPRPMRRRRERTVLAVLLAAHGRRSRRSGWSPTCGASRPAAGLGSLQVAVSRLRADLEPDRSPREAPRLLVSTGGGYALVAGTADVDAWQFESLADPRPRHATTPPTRCALGEQATRAGGPGRRTPTATPTSLARERDRLEELRASLLERRAEDLLALGRDREALARRRRRARRQPLPRAALGGARARPLPRRPPGRGTGDAADPARSGWPTSSGSTRPRRCRSSSSGCSARTPGCCRRRAGGPPGLPAPAAGRPAAPPRPSPAAPPGHRGPRGRRASGSDRLLDALAAGGPVAVLEPSRASRASARPVLVEDLLRLAGRPRGSGPRSGRCPESGLAPPLWPWVGRRPQPWPARGPAPDAAAPAARGPARRGRPRRRDQAAAVRRRGRPAWSAAATRAGGLVVVLEDLHRADASSLQLLAHLGRPRRRRPLLVVVTRRVHRRRPPPRSRWSRRWRRWPAPGPSGSGSRASTPPRSARLMSGLLGDHDPAARRRGWPRRPPGTRSTSPSTRGCSPPAPTSPASTPTGCPCRTAYGTCCGSGWDGCPRRPAPCSARPPCWASSSTRRSSRPSPGSRRRRCSTSSTWRSPPGCWSGTARASASRTR